MILPGASLQLELDLVQVTDEEALPLIFDLLKQEGFCMGGSTAINIGGTLNSFSNYIYLCTPVQAFVKFVLPCTDHELFSCLFTIPTLTRFSSSARSNKVSEGAWARPHHCDHSMRFGYQVSE